MKIDIHCHILPPRWPDLKERYGYGGFVRLDHHKPGCARMMKDDQFFREVEENLWDPDKRLEECARDRVDVQVLSTVPVMFSYWARPQDALDLSRMLNDHVAEVVAGAPRRFVGLGTAPLQAPELAAKELERCVTQLGMAGLQIGSHVNDWNLDDKRLWPFYEAAEALGAALFVHPWDMMGMKETPRYWMPWLVGMPAETTRAVCSILMGGVLDRFPKLRFAFAHGGGSFPATLGRIQHGFDVRPDLCQTRTSTAPVVLAEKLYFDSLVHDPEALRLLVKKFGPERIALGTDYPFPLGELSPGRLIEAMPDLTAAQKEVMLSGAALEFLGRARAAFETPESLAHSASLAGCAYEILSKVPYSLENYG
jgi:aminocarboxymuconate-semialdehyde decarboxylase